MKTQQYFYVAVHDAGRSSLLAGPYLTEQEAVDARKAVRLAAERIDPWASFYTFSLARAPDERKTLFGLVRPDERPPQSESLDKERKRIAAYRH